MRVLLALAVAAAAAPPTLSFRVTGAKGVYTHAVQAKLEDQQNAVVPVGDARLVANTVLTRSGSGYELQYQLEVSPGQGHAGQTFQAQGQLALRAGVPVMSAACGPWKLELGVDVKNKKAGPEFGANDGNVRVVADYWQGKTKIRCTQVLKAGAQGNVVDGGSDGGKRIGTIFNALPAMEKGKVLLQYQFERTPPGGKTVQLQNEATLTLEKRLTVVNGHYAFYLLAQGKARAAAKASRDEDDENEGD